MSRPRIGLTLDVAGDGRRYLLKREYADAVLEAGGLPVPLVFPGRGGAPDLLALVDGLVVTGGAFDVPPELYGEVRRPACGPCKPERTEAELALLREALAAQLPLLGVCGGMQLLAVACGGTLWQDLPTDLGGRALGHEQPPPRDLPTHEVRVEPGTLLARLVGEAPLRVNSTHHQAVKDPGRGTAVSGRAADGVIEAIELPAQRFALGVQWHPEAVRVHEPRSELVYAGLVEAARGRR